MKLRIIALLLAIFCFVTTLTACDLFGGKENSTEEEAEESETMEVHPTIEQTNYNDTCYMHVFEHINNLYTEKSDSDVLSEALYARQEQLYNYLGVDLVGELPFHEDTLPIFLQHSHPDGAAAEGHRDLEQSERESPCAPRQEGTVVSKAPGCTR